MRLVRERLQPVRHPYQIVPALERVARRVPGAAIGM